MRQIPLPLNKSAMEVIYKGQFQTFFLENIPFTLRYTLRLVDKVLVAILGVMALQF